MKDRCERLWFRNLPALEESDVEERSVEVDELEAVHFQSEIVVVVSGSSRHFWKKEESGCHCAFAAKEHTSKRTDVGQMDGQNTVDLKSKRIKKNSNI